LTTGLLCNLISNLKKEYVKNDKSKNFIREFIPISNSTFPISNHFLEGMHEFMENNKIYHTKYEVELLGIPCISYGGDINNYWLSSKKYDTNYQPFYPTWMISSYLLALATTEMGFTDLIDIGSGDGRLNYCAQLLGLRSISVEIDTNLCSLQEEIKRRANVIYELIQENANCIDLTKLKLSHPMIFISAQPELGEMLANALMKQIPSISNRCSFVGVNLMGTSQPRIYDRDHSLFGWGRFINDYKLSLLQVMTLPTTWTVDQDSDTPYLFTLVK
jgi:hypothetical protein